MNQLPPEIINLIFSYMEGQTNHIMKTEQKRCYEEFIEYYPNIDFNFNQYCYYIRDYKNRRTKPVIRRTIGRYVFRGRDEIHSQIILLTPPLNDGNIKPSDIKKVNGEDEDDDDDDDDDDNDE
jgi:hypothetical protein